RRVDGPPSGQQISRIGDGGEGNDAVDRRQQTDASLLGDVLAVVFEIALQHKAVARFVVDAQADEFSVSVHIADAVIQVDRRAIDSNAQLSLRAVPAADVDRASDLAE